MKIEKLYTLSQFVDFLEEKMPFFDGESELLNCAENYRAIEKYNEFLKHPLKKEMVVNEIERTTWEDVDKMSLTPGEKESAYCQLMHRWRQAEKKVIFENAEILPLSKGDRVKDLFVSKRFIDRSNIHGEFNFQGTTLEDLAELTKGVFILKNVEL